jgi:hypothetical protein
MAQNALSIFINDTDKAKLQEIFGGIVENIQKKLLSSRLKSLNFKGDIKAGSVKFKRFVNSQSQNYGTARAAGKGAKITAPETVVNLDVYKEIIEEVEFSDIEKFGVPGLVERRRKNHLNSMAREFETAFFSAAVSGGTAFTPTTVPTGSNQLDILEEAAVALETTKNGYVDGVERNLITAVVSAQFYSQIRKSLDVLPTNNTSVDKENITSYHGIAIESSIYLPSTVAFNLQAAETIAQPTYIKPYDAEKIPLSNTAAIELFYEYGTAVLAPELSTYVLNSALAVPEPGEN